MVNLDAILLVVQNISGDVEVNVRLNQIKGFRVKLELDELGEKLWDQRGTFLAVQRGWYTDPTPQMQCHSNGSSGEMIDEDIPFVSLRAGGFAHRDVWGDWGRTLFYGWRSPESGGRHSGWTHHRAHAPMLPRFHLMFGAGIYQRWIWYCSYSRWLHSLEVSVPYQAV